MSIYSNVKNQSLFKALKSTLLGEYGRSLRDWTDGWLFFSSTVCHFNVNKENLSLACKVQG